MLFSKKQAEQTWLIVGLGNPGPTYRGTRHNAGYCAVEAFAERYHIAFSTKKAEGWIGKGTAEGQRIVVIKPLTFMNRSGDCVGRLARFYKVPNDHVLVFSDDISLPVGTVRLRANGSAGGHNGLKDIIAKLPGEDFPRIKIGVGQKPCADTDLVDWVLGKIPPEEQDRYQSALRRAAEAAGWLLAKGMESAMNRYNG